MVPIAVHCITILPRPLGGYEYSVPSWVPGMNSPNDLSGWVRAEGYGTILGRVVILLPNRLEKLGCEVN
jgi:hypothetical protein